MSRLFLATYVIEYLHITIITTNPGRNAYRGFMFFWYLQKGKITIDLKGAASTLTQLAELHQMTAADLRAILSDDITSANDDQPDLNIAVDLSDALELEIARQLSDNGR